MPRRNPWIPRAIVATAAMMAAATALAQPESQQEALAPEPAKTDAPALAPCSDERPWYCGVSEEDQQRAMELYEQGNRHFDDSLFPDAMTSYRAALVHWNHPGIHYNLMLALVALDHSIEAYKSSLEALRYGPDALEAEEHRRARDYHKLLRGRIAELTVACDEPGAEVTLDGMTILQGPGEAHIFVLPGQHEIVARKPGYLATHHTLLLAPEKPASVRLRLLPSAEALVTTRRWDVWQPWAVVGAGVGVGLVGGLLEWRSDVNNVQFANLFEKGCEDGCRASEFSDEMESRQQRYRWYRRLGHSASVAGGAAMVGGLVLVYLNRSQQVENPERQRLVRVSMTPLVAPDTAGLTVDLSF
jgi:PEGA domain